MTRSARLQRTTAETEVSVTLNLDGSGEAKVDTGVGFFDHLLTTFACHSLIDMEVRTRGDLDVDDHHTVEDTSLVLGGAIAEALGDRAGITRFGDASVPMDDALATAAIDAGGRPYAAVDITFRGERLGALSTQNVSHAVESLARTAGFTVHLSASGANDHHTAEAAFKALGRAVRAAVAPDERRLGIPSTKDAT